jgi:hypothetical protein
MPTLPIAANHFYEKERCEDFWEKVDEQLADLVEMGPMAEKHPGD